MTHIEPYGWRALTFKFIPIDTFTTCAIPPGKITALQHEVGDYTVESGPLVAKTMFVSSKLAEICGSPGNDVIKEPEDDATRGLPINRDIELSINGTTVRVVKQKDAEGNLRKR